MSEKHTQAILLILKKHNQGCLAWFALGMVSAISFRTIGR